jgi:hypothetical protein
VRSANDTCENQGAWGAKCLTKIEALVGGAHSGNAHRKVPDLRNTKAKALEKTEAATATDDETKKTPSTTRSQSFTAGAPSQRWSGKRRVREEGKTRSSNDKKRNPYRLVFKMNADCMRA